MYVSNGSMYKLPLLSAVVVKCTSVFVTIFFQISGFVDTPKNNHHTTTVDKDIIIFTLISLSNKKKKYDLEHSNIYYV